MTEPRLIFPGIAGKRALVTGAAGGIGRATALLLDRMGAHVTVGDIDEAGLQATAEAMSEARLYPYDARDAESCEILVSAAAEGGGLHILCNIAGRLDWGVTDDIDAAHFAEILQINLVSTYAMCRAAHPHLALSQGSVVNTASTAALIGIPFAAAYSASKHGVAGLTKSLALEWAAERIRVNAICPGQVNTAMSRQCPPAGLDQALLMRSAPKLPDGVLEPEDVATQIVWLASDSCRHMTGSLVTLDAGQVAG